MAIVTSAEQLAGPHLKVYEEYWSLADTKKNGSLGAQDAVVFLKKSGLSDIILSKIWDLSDSGAKGYLDKDGFFRALKLISLVQGGQEATVGNLASSSGAPNLGPLPANDTSSGWRVTANEKSKYDAIFESLQPVSGKLGGDKVKPVLMNSNLPVEILGKIWEFADHNKDGCLDSEEFAVAMHLVYHSLEQKPLPATVPADLIPPSQRCAALSGHKPPVGGVPVLPVMPTLNTGSSVASETSWAPTAVPASMNRAPQMMATWVVSPQLRMSSDARFQQLDTDNDGLVNGMEIRDIFLQSGLQQQTLANIWALCDSNGVGSLNREQFALAMYFIEEKSTKGMDPPAQLTPDMIPPSMRSASDPGTGNSEFSKELLEIEAEIEEIKRRKISLEGEKQQRDADLKIKCGEVQTLQKEYESINSTIQLLEKQRGEAQKKLDEMEDQRTTLDTDVNEVKDKCASKQKEIDEMKEQISQQERGEREQEAELGRLKEEFLALHAEEKKLEQRLRETKEHVEQLRLNRQQISRQKQESQQHIEALEKANDALSLALRQYEALINNEEGAQEPDQSVLTEVAVPASQSITIDFTMSSTNHSSALSTDNNAFAGFVAQKDDAFGSEDPFANFGATTTNSSGAFMSNGDPFGTDDPFKQSVGFDDDPFTKDADPFKSDPFGKADPFNGKADPFNGKDDPFKSTDPFSKDDPFASTGEADFGGFGSSDPFAGNTFKTTEQERSKSTDPFGSNDLFSGANSQPARSASAVPMNHSEFDPFGQSSGTAASSSTDPFGFDPFSSSAPVDSPNIKKKPPPRPALPRPKGVADTLAFNADPFGMAGSTSSTKKPRPKAVTPPVSEALAGFGGADPFASSDPFGSGKTSTAGGNDPFGSFADFGSGFDTDKTLDKEMAWAAADSAKMEAERRQQLEEQERADFEFALALSKAESGA